MTMKIFSSKISSLLGLKHGNDVLPSADKKNTLIQPITTASSTTDATALSLVKTDSIKYNGQADYAAGDGPTKVEVTDLEAEKQTSVKTPKTTWPLWKRLALAGCVLAISISVGLGVGLGVGLTRHKDSSSGSQGGGHTSNSGSRGDSALGQAGGSADRPGKLAVYWGAKLDTVPLDVVCADSSYDIVNIAFLSYIFADGQYPRLAIPSLNGSSAAQKTAGAVDLQDGTSLIPAMEKCQANGKLVLLSMGGAAGYADVRLNSDAQGQQAADMIWNLFLGGTKNPDIRPFGHIVLDGVDFDNESGQWTGYQAMAQTFRSHFRNDTSRRYYMTAAPQCPFTAADDADELGLFQHLDYVSVQFYNNDVCNLAQSGFEASVRRWSSAIGGEMVLLVGALASDADGDKGYVDARTLGDELGRVRAMNLANFGGVTLWEAELAVQNDNYQEKVKAQL